MAWNSLGVVVSAATAQGIGMMTLPPELVKAIQTQPEAAPVWLSWSANIVALLVANGITLVIVFVGLRRSGRWERGVMVEQLAGEVGTLAVTQDEYAQIQGRCEPPRDKVARAIFTGQCNLAKRKFRLHLNNRSVDDDPVVQAWREDLALLRQPAQVVRANA
jgi:hypothetical protein